MVEVLNDSSAALDDCADAVAVVVVASVGSCRRSNTCRPTALSAQLSANSSVVRTWRSCMIFEMPYALTRYVRDTIALIGASIPLPTTTPTALGLARCIHVGG